MDLSNIGSWFVILYLAYLTSYLFSFVRTKNRKSTQTTNVRLEELRKIPIKTMEEQREFLELRYPKSVWKWSFKSVGKVIIQIIVFIFLFKVYSTILNYIGISFSLLQGILFITIVPILVNLVLRKFNLHTNDLSVFFR